MTTTLFTTALTVHVPLEVNVWMVFPPDVVMVPPVAVIWPVTYVMTTAPF